MEQFYNLNHHTKLDTQHMLYILKYNKDNINIELSIVSTIINPKATLELAKAKINALEQTQFNLLFKERLNDFFITMNDYYDILFCVENGLSII